MAARHAVATKAQDGEIETRPKWAKELTDQEYLWCAAYLVDFSPTHAAIAAGWSPRSAYSTGFRVKNRPHVRVAIDAALAERMPSIKLTLAERLAAIVSGDLSKVVNWKTEKITYIDEIVTTKGKEKKRRTARSLNFAIRDLGELPPEIRTSIKKVRKRVTQYGTTIDVELHDPIQAAGLLMQLLGLVKPDDASQGGAVTFVIETPEGSRLHLDHNVTIDEAAIEQGREAVKARQPEDVPPGTPIRFETP